MVSYTDARSTGSSPGRQGSFRSRPGTKSYLRTPQYVRGGAEKEIWPRPGIPTNAHKEVRANDTVVLAQHVRPGHRKVAVQGRHDSVLTVNGMGARKEFARGLLAYNELMAGCIFQKKRLRQATTQITTRWELSPLVPMTTHAGAAVKVLCCVHTGFDCPCVNCPIVYDEKSASGILSRRYSNSLASSNLWALHTCEHGQRCEQTSGVYMPLAHRTPCGPAHTASFRRGQWTQQAGGGRHHGRRSTRSANKGRVSACDKRTHAQPPRRGDSTNCSMAGELEQTRNSHHDSDTTTSVE